VNDEPPKPPKPPEPATPDVALLNENDGPEVGALLTLWA